MLETMTLTDSTIHDEKTYLVQTYARPDFVLVRGAGMTLYDADNRPYEDWVAGIAVNALGYGPTGIDKVLLEQLASGIVHTSNLYYTVPQTRLAKLLVDSSFADRVFFTNSGTEANEGAIKFARRLAHHSGVADKHEIVAFSHAFHGRTMGSLTMTPKEKYQLPFKPLLPGVQVGEFNDSASARALIHERTAAVFVEPIQGEGGIHIASDAFLRTLRDLCDRHGALLVFDEVQCGMGRTGKLWAHEHTGITPDILTTAKPLAAGLPIGAILVTERVAAAIQPGDHGSTFAGGPIITAVAAAVLERIQQPAFLAHVADTGAYLMERLAEINSPLIKEVRGRGLMVGLEMTMDVAPLVKAGYAHGLLLVNAGTHVIRLVPPLIATRADVDTLVARLTTMLEAHHA
ncbi:MAG: aspartate aminotransferase family protein [Anaerolineae bacterium]|nr:aspartate aminotransferase family protein [Anaerolineae bacterium]